MNANGGLRQWITAAMFAVILMLISWTFSSGTARMDALAVEVRMNSQETRALQIQVSVLAEQVRQIRQSGSRFP